MKLKNIVDKKIVALLLLLALEFPIVGGLYVLISIIVLSIAEGLNFEKNNFIPLYLENIFMVLWFIYSVIAIKLVGQDLISKFKIPFSFFKFFSYSILLGLIISLVTRFITIYTYHYFPTPDEIRFPETQIEYFPDKVFYFFYIIVPAAAVEEIFFRGLIFSGFRAKYNFYITTLLTTLIFLTLHPYPEYLLSYFTGSVIVCFIYEKWKSLPIVIIIHIIINGCSMFGIWDYLLNELAKVY